MNKILPLIKEYTSNAIPILTVVFSIFLTFIPYQIDNIDLLLPHIPYIVIYFWTVFRFQSLSYPLLLTLGLFKDLLESNILGINALYFLLFRAIIISQRKYISHNIFIVIWTGFAFCLSIILLLPLLLNKFGININHYPLYITSIQWLITIFAYVPFHLLLNKLNNLRY